MLFFWSIFQSSCVTFVMLLRYWMRINCYGVHCIETLSELYFFTDPGIRCTEYKAGLFDRFCFDKKQAMSRQNQNLYISHLV